MRVEANRCDATDIRALRDEFVRALDYQFVLYSWFERGWTDPFLLLLDRRPVGYGLVGAGPSEPRNAVVEFHVLPDARQNARALFEAFLAASAARRIEFQTNDTLLASMAGNFANDLQPAAILFGARNDTTLTVPGVTFRACRADERDRIFAHTHEPVGDWVIEADGTIVATGGLLFHYNPPFGDIYMEVAEARRRRGCGSFLVQELKRVCREMGKIPAARCNVSNVASRATLVKAGMIPCGNLVTGRLMTRNHDA